MADEALVAAQAALDQAQAAVEDYRGTYDEAANAYAAIHDERNAAVDEFKRRLNEAAGAVEATSAELERREGAVRAAQAKVADIESGGTGEAPPPQDVGGEG
jgi:outer membrane protein TolC